MLMYLEISAPGAIDHKAWIAPGGRLGLLLLRRHGSDIDLHELGERVIENVPEDGEPDLSRIAANLEASGLAGWGVLHASEAKDSIKCITAGATLLVRCGRQTVREERPTSVTPSNQRYDLSVEPGSLDRWLLLPASAKLHRLKLQENPSIISANCLRDWREIGSRCLPGDDWAFLSFPAESLELAPSGFPYDPFVGPQEEHLHEKQGLVKIAAALFRRPAFHGFRICSAPVFTGAKSSRLFDGVLISPFGITLLELKDWSGTLELNSQFLHGTNHRSTSPRPIPNLEDGLRRIPGIKLPVDISRDQIHGALVFTNPAADVSFIGPDGKAQPLPVRRGMVFAASAERLPRFLEEQLSKDVRLAHRLRESQIVQIARVITDPAAMRTSRATNAEGRMSGFTFETAPLSGQSQKYVSHHSGWMEGTEIPVIVKKFRIGALSLDSESEKRRVARECQALNRLASRPEFQNYYHHELHGDELMVAVEAVGGPTLDEWLTTHRDRSDKLQVLRSLAAAIAILEQLKIVHRALRPATIRMREGEPVITDFELCRMDHIATLAASARSTIDLKYAAPEVQRAGAEIDSAADVFSLGVIAVEVLSGVCPFEHSGDMMRQLRSQPDFWSRQAAACGLEPCQSESLHKLFALNPARRASCVEAAEIIGGWK